MKPSEYKDRYENLEVLLGDGSTSKVTVNQYRLAGVNVDEKAKDAFIEKLRNGIDMELRVSTETVKVHSRGRGDEWERLVLLPFLGKGSPEHCQIVLQLAGHWGLAGRPANLQKYADSYLGLDCNGFVGNFLWHEMRGNPWRSLGVGKHEVGPSTSIDGFFDGKTPVEKWDDLDPGRSYIMGRVNSKTGVIIPGGSGKQAGHIVITDAGTVDRRPGGKDGLTKDKDGKDSFPLRCRAIESTGGHKPEGLWESWYSCQSVDEKKTRRKHAFEIYREDMIAGHQYYSFQIAAVD